MEKKKINFSEEERARRGKQEDRRGVRESEARLLEKIEDEFNSRHNVTPRKWTQLKKCWENMKDKWRRTNAEDMRERFATGGGTPPSSEMTDELRRVGDIASHTAVHTCRCTAVADPRHASRRVRWYGSFVFFSLRMF
ncbi:hypothetical protein HPB52_014030 [Rhipicephalus sanguineus]|uniref:Regulatory protein zeste n=1 Tax=Rhipicephalus sanguineus TaxID=34632 RepID=A0A9D4PWF6_RHISA|nr:hypothetical protein HPB52_014030 [Rhipicephalus sanguineus]